MLIGSKVAISYTVKNEASLICENLDFHRKLGVSHFFIFFDNTTDVAPKLLQTRSDLTCRESVKPDELQDQFLTSKFLKSIDNHDARRVFNSSWAAIKAKEMGFDWLIAIDADELVLCDFASMDKTRIDLRLAQISPEINQVVFKAYEQVPRFIEKSNSFLEHTEFIKQESGSKERKIYDPLSKATIELNRLFMGHDSGKAAFRLSLLDACYPLTHRWHRRSDDTVEDFIIIDALLHFYFYDFNKFRERYLNYQGRSAFSIANYKYPTHVTKLIELAGELNESDFMDYYKQQICFSDKLPDYMERNLVKPKVLKDLLRKLV